mmetsp:Transcript_30198/g.26750  ORF Transcript_30198/g.26750 Transcript_30198/m.26750 type:complete len:101 (+) Transcript_30198:749-1051(+)
MHKNKKKAINVNSRLSNAELDAKLMKALENDKNVFKKNIPKEKSSEHNNLLQMFLKKLETIKETIEDLKEVAKLVPEYSKENVIVEEASGGAKSGKLVLR